MKKENISLNPFSKYFLKGKNFEREAQEEYINNAQGIAEDEGAIELYKKNKAASIADNFNYTGDIYSSPIHFQQFFDSKTQRISKYREMSYYPDISDALDMISDDAVLEDEKGNIISLAFNKDLNNRDKRLILNEWNHLNNNVIKVKERLWDWFRKWLIEGELYLEIVLNDKKDGIVGLKPLPAFNMMPIYVSDIIHEYTQTISKNSPGKSPEENTLVFPPEQILYVNWGKYEGTKVNVKGYLEDVVRVYNQLRNLEDALVVYRLVRAPERRVWNVEIGRMTTGKAEEHVKKLINQYRKQSNYDPVTGAIDSAQNVQSLTEDFWFPKREGQGTTVDSLPSGVQLGELEDVNYFLGKLRQILKVPKDRFIDQTGGTYSSGRSIEREEIRFTKFIMRQQNRFKIIFNQLLIQQLRFKGFDDKFLDKNLYDFKWSKSNFYQEFKAQEVIESRINTWASMSSYVVSKEEPNGAYSKEYVMEHYMNMTKAEIEENEEKRKKEMAIVKKELAEEEGEFEDEDGDGEPDGGEEVEQKEPEKEPEEKPKEAQPKPESKE